MYVDNNSAPNIRRKNETIPSNIILIIYANVLDFILYNVLVNIKSEILQLIHVYDIAFLCPCHCIIFYFKVERSICLS